ncbi:hypothetical protein RRG08_042573 [Elysia crispata]|uniref:Uncharacterized protein n=1 Tax=Elysia crispata TaxID=231223 RepID=A0AAE0XQB3_9GAST|nr:hypothetical protein RRG08_042573 [Elysia crispata]
MKQRMGAGRGDAASLAINAKPESVPSNCDASSLTRLAVPPSKKSSFCPGAPHRKDQRSSGALWRCQDAHQTECPYRLGSAQIEPPTLKSSSGSQHQRTNASTRGPALVPLLNPGANSDCQVSLIRAIAQSTIFAVTISVALFRHGRGKRACFCR